MTSAPRDYRMAHLLPVFQEPVRPVPPVETEPIEPPHPEPVPAPRRKPKPSNRPVGDGKGVERYVKWYRNEGYRRKLKERPPDYPTY